MIKRMRKDDLYEEIFKKLDDADIYDYNNFSTYEDLKLEVKSVLEDVLSEYTIIPCGLILE